MSIEGQIAYMHFAGLHFTYREFMMMPKSRRLTFLDIAEQHVEAQQPKTPPK